MIFKKDLSFPECKDYLLMQIRQLEPKEQSSTSKSITLKVQKKNRIITIVLSIMNGKAILDITDSYYLLRIPRETFTSIDKYKMYVIQIASRLYDELGITNNG